MSIFRPLKQLGDDKKPNLAKAMDIRFPLNTFFNIKKNTLQLHKYYLVRSRIPFS